MAIDNYYDRTDPAKHYERHLFRAGYGLQAAELNEIQQAAIGRVQSIGDALFKDGDIVKDCACLVDQDTGAVTLNGTPLLGLDEAGLDMSTTTRNLTMNCPVELRVSTLHKVFLVLKKSLKDVYQRTQLLFLRLTEKFLRSLIMVRKKL